MPNVNAEEVGVDEDVAAVGVNVNPPEAGAVVLVDDAEGLSNANEPTEGGAGGALGAEVDAVAVGLAWTAFVSLLG